MKKSIEKNMKKKTKVLIFFGCEHVHEAIPSIRKSRVKMPWHLRGLSGMLHGKFTFYAARKDEEE
jgi:hypothetical protein